MKEIVFLLVAAGSLLQTFSTSAAVRIWSGGGTSGFWSQAANWGGTAPASGDDLVFPSGAARLMNTNNFSVLRLNSITFSGAGGGYQIFGNAVTLTNGINAQQSTATNSFGCDITLAANQPFAVPDADAGLTLSGDINLNGFDLSVNTSGDVRITGAVSGTGDLTKNGNGQLSFSGTPANTYNGTTRVNTGTLFLGKFVITSIIPLVIEGRISVPGPLIIGNGSATDIVRLGAVDQIGDSAAVTIQTGGLLDLNDALDTIGTLNMTAGAVDTGPNGRLTLAGNVTVNISSTNATIIGNLNLGGATRTFSVAEGPNALDLRIYADIVGSGGITIVGGGHVRFDGTNTYSGVTTLRDDSRLIAANVFALGSSAGGTVLDPGILALPAAGTIAGESLTINGGISQVNHCCGHLVWSGNIVANDWVQFFSGSPGVLELSGVISGSGLITISGEAPVRLSGSTDNTHIGQITVAGILELAKNGAGVQSINSGATLNIGNDIGASDSDIVRYIGTSTSQIHSSARIIINSSGLLDLNGHSDDVGEITMENARITTGGGVLTLTDDVTVLPTFSTIDGIISLLGNRTFHIPQHIDYSLNVFAEIRGSGGIIKTGLGRLDLWGLNTYTGATLVNDGTLMVRHDLGLGSSSAGTTVQSGGTLALASDTHVTAESLTAGGSGALLRGALYGCCSGSNSWGGPIVLAGDTDINVFTATYLNLYGPISGTGQLLKQGAGTLIFSGGAGSANTYDGRTFASFGTLELAKSIANAAVPGELWIRQAYVRVQPLASQIADLSRVFITSLGTLDVGVSLERIGSLEGSGLLDLNSGTLETGNAGGTNTFSGTIIGNGGNLHLIGGATMTLTGTNTHTGFTRVVNGTLFVDGIQPASRLDVTFGLLGGSGIVGHLTVAGNLNPGRTPTVVNPFQHHLTCSNLTFTGAGDYFVELNGLNAEYHDRALVRGSVSLNGARLHPTLGFAPAVGDSVTIIINDGADPIAGTFASLGENALLTIDNLQFRISYTGGDGNDVTLTCASTPLQPFNSEVLPPQVLAGNGNGIIDPDECNNFRVVLYNNSAAAISGATGVLASKSPFALVTQPFASFPTIPSDGVAANDPPFQIRVMSNFPCGENLPFELVVTTPVNGTFSVPVLLPTGVPGAPLQYGNNNPIGIVDSGSITSTINVTSFPSPLAKLTVSLFISHANDADLDVTLIGPNGTNIVLTSDNGGAGNSYGTSCVEAQRTTFDDSAAAGIISGSAPFVGRFRPEGRLRDFIGTVPALVNGTWRLIVTDDTAGNTGALNCWSLSLSPATCEPGTGGCQTCLPPIAGTLSDSSPTMPTRLFRNGVSSGCGNVNECPGITAASAPFRLASHVFTNLGPEACVSVVLSVPCTNSVNQLMASAYLGGLNTDDLCSRFLGYSGNSTIDGAVGFSLKVPAGARFIIFVNDVADHGCPNYTLELYGLEECPSPTLHIAREPDPAKVRLYWSSAYPEYQLQRAPSLNPPPPFPFANWPTDVGIVNGNYTVITNATAGDEYFRLIKY